MQIYYNIYMKLNHLKTGKKGIIVTVGGNGALRRRLLDLGLTPKTEITVIKYAPLGDPIEVSLRGFELTLRKDEAAVVDVREVTPNKAAAKASGNASTIAAAKASSSASTIAAPNTASNASVDGTTTTATPGRENNV